MKKLLCITLLFLSASYINSMAKENGNESRKALIGKRINAEELSERGFTHTDARDFEPGEHIGLKRSNSGNVIEARVGIIGDREKGERDFTKIQVKTRPEQSKLEMIPVENVCKLREHYIDPNVSSAASFRNAK